LTLAEQWKDKQSALADTQKKLDEYRKLLKPEYGMIGGPEYEKAIVTQRAAEPNAVKKIAEYEAQLVADGEDLARIGRQMAAENPQAEVLESRLGLLMPTMGNKAKVLEDPDVKNVFRDFAGRARTVVDAFSGSGKVTEAMKDLGARTVLNVKDPRYFALFKEVKDNPVDFADRVQQAITPIEAPRSGGAPYMRDGSDIQVYLNNLQAQDPTVALLIQSQFIPRGGEVPEGFQGALRAQRSTYGLQQLPDIIRNLSPKIDRLSSVDGWTAARNARAGQGVVIDPPYVNARNKYAAETRTIRPEERIRDYQRAVLPGVQKGAHYLIFDQADPKLMQFLENNGFQVREFTRPRATQPEFVATNGEVLESRVSGGKVFDVLNSAATHTTFDENNDMWFKPYDLDYFRNTFGPAFGSKMELRMRGGQWGYLISERDLNRLTEMDVNRMPAPQLRNRSGGDSQEPARHKGTMCKRRSTSSDIYYMLSPNTGYFIGEDSKQRPLWHGHLTHGLE
jgi:hypothetical protein